MAEERILTEAEHNALVAEINEQRRADGNKPLPICSRCGHTHTPSGSNCGCAGCKCEGPHRPWVSLV